MGRTPAQGAEGSAGTSCPAAGRGAGPHPWRCLGASPCSTRGAGGAGGTLRCPRLSDSRYRGRQGLHTLAQKASRTHGSAASRGGVTLSRAPGLHPPPLWTPLTPEAAASSTTNSSANSHTLPPVSPARTPAPSSSAFAGLFLSLGFQGPRRQGRGGRAATANSTPPPRPWAL